MTPAMTPAVALAVAVVALLLAVGSALAVLPLLAARRRLEHDLVRARADLDALGQRLQRLERDRPDGPAVDAPHLITSLAAPAQVDLDPGSRLTGREFASVALGESLLKVAALASGVRRASSAENRNRIRFEMGREVKRQRRQRRLDLRLARRRLREEQLRSNAADPSLREDAA